MGWNLYYGSNAMTAILKVLEYQYKTKQSQNSLSKCDKKDETYKAYNSSVPSAADQIIFVSLLSPLMLHEAASTQYGHHAPRGSHTLMISSTSPQCMI